MCVSRMLALCWGEESNHREGLRVRMPSDRAQGTQVRELSPLIAVLCGNMVTAPGPEFPSMFLRWLSLPVGGPPHLLAPVHLSCTKQNKQKKISLALRLRLSGALHWLWGSRPCFSCLLSAPVLLLNGHHGRSLRGSEVVPVKAGTKPDT